MTHRFAVAGALLISTPALADKPPITDAALAGDVATIVAKGKLESGARVTSTVFLGWTAKNAAAFRTTICDPDELGARGPWCEIDVCLASPTVGETIPPLACSDDVALGPYDTTPPVAADLVKTLRDHETALAPVAAGKSLAASTVAFAFKPPRVTLAVPGRAKPLVVFTDTVDDGDRPVGVRSVKLGTVSRSPDAACTAVVGIAIHHGFYEGVGGNIPEPLGIVVCTKRP